jgi:hypothetical protein
MILVIVGFSALLQPTVAASQTSAEGSAEHRWIVEEFFFAPSWPGRADYYTGEMLRSYAGSGVFTEMGGRARRHTLRLVEERDDYAVYTVETEQGDRVVDWYAHLRKESGGWRLTALRTLWLPPLFFILLDSLEAAPKPLSDTFQVELENMHLTVSSDSTLKTKFVDLRPSLEKIADRFDRESVRSVRAAPYGLDAPTPELRDLARALAAIRFSRVYGRAPGCVFVEIGGMIDNAVGFLRCAPDGEPPRMTPEEFILVEPLGDGWYLYKTT